MAGLHAGFPQLFWEWQVESGSGKGKFRNYIFPRELLASLCISGGRHLSELRVASAWAGDNICLRLGHLAEPSVLSGPGTASVWAQDMCLYLAQHLSGPGATSSWPEGNVSLSPGHLSDLGTSAEPGTIPV